MNITKAKGVLIALKFLYIDLFVIIPVAVSSELLETIRCCDTDRHVISGSDTPLSDDTPQETDGEPCVKECPCQYHRPDHHYKRSPVLGIFLGTEPALVSAVTFTWWEE